MVRGRKVFDPADVVVWTTAVLLSLLCGAGVGFVLWSMLFGMSAPLSLQAVVYAGGLLVGALLSYRKELHVRLVIALGLLALLVSFSFGSLLWAPLLGG
jgi:hypothetical protein